MQNGASGLVAQLIPADSGHYPNPNSLGVAVYIVTMPRLCRTYF